MMATATVSRARIDRIALPRREQRDAGRGEADRPAARIGRGERDVDRAARPSLDVHAHRAAAVGLRDDARAARAALVEEQAEVGRRQEILLDRLAGAVEELERPAGDLQVAVAGGDRDAEI